ncbi:MAG: carboxypeptidase regulatory-like domain-containing protein [Lachnospiraceae bacterium]|nr:carboxypeptidase regulatory-like domain-containing protein [Lachnospiraceae bacterium]
MYYLNTIRNIKRNKKNTFFMLLMALILTILVSPFPVKAIDIENDYIFFMPEHPAFTQSDVESNFTNYAERGATREIHTTGFATNVVGIVLDSVNGEALPTATILAVGSTSIEIFSDANGKFNIQNMPCDIYNWYISADGYRNAEYHNYSIDIGDTIIFTFFLNAHEEIHVNRNDFYRNERSVLPEDLLHSSIDFNNEVSRNMTSPPIVKANIRVLNNNNTITTVGRRDYLYAVVSSELYTENWYTQRGLSSAQVQQLYRAQALAANAFTEYACKVYSPHSALTADVCRTTCCQVYDPTKITTIAINAVNTIFENNGGTWNTALVMHRPTNSTYAYIWGAYFSSCGNQGTLAHAGQPALLAKICTDLTNGVGGHRKGLCQMGAAERAKNGNTGVQIINHYYTNCSLVTCTLG